MLVYVETTSGSVFSIRMNPWDTVLDIKTMIEKSQGFTVFSQELYFKGMPLGNDNMPLVICNIVNNSRLLLVLPDGHYIKDSLVKNQGWPGMVTYDQMLRQAMQSMVPSNATEGFVNQRWPAMVGRNNDQLLQQTAQSPVSQAFFNQGWPAMARSKNDQMLQQTEQSMIPSNVLHQTVQSPVLQAFLNQGSPAMARRNHDQMLQQTELSLAPSNVIHQTAQSPVPEALFDQGSPAMARSNNDQELHQTVESPLNSCSVDELLQIVSDMPVTTQGNVNIQESSGRNDKNQDLLQRESSSHPSNTFGDFSFGDDRFLSTEHFTNIQSYRPASTTEAIINENQVLQTGQSTVPSHSTEQRINTQDLPVRVGRNSDQVVQSEKSPPIREVINIPDSPVKVGGFKMPPQRLRVMVLPYSRENKPVSKFPVNVDASEKVEELKKELEKIQQRSPLDLPEEGYYFIHKHIMLDEDQSFRWNGVAHGDTIEIFPGYIPKETRRAGGLGRTFGI